jgi:hypothetical protein
VIPDIGLMIGFYIITRMISFLTRKEPMAENLVVKVFAVITLFVTMIALLDLLLRGTTSGMGGM